MCTFRLVYTACKCRQQSITHTARGAQMNRLCPAPAQPALTSSQCYPRSKDLNRAKHHLVGCSLVTLRTSPLWHHRQQEDFAGIKAAKRKHPPAGAVFCAVAQACSHPGQFLLLAGNGGAGEEASVISQCMPN